MNYKLKLCIIFLLFLFIQSCAPQSGFTLEKAQEIEKQGWDMVPEILARIVPPSFPEKEFNILAYGAKAGGTTDCNESIQKAINACGESGGGKVVIPAGEYLSNGPLHLLDNVNLHIAEGALLKFGTNPYDYTPLALVRWEGTLCYNYSPLIYANGKKNIAVSGKGIIDGQTQGTWALWKRGNDGKNQDHDKTVLRQHGNDVTPVETRVFGNGFLDLDGDGKDDGHGDGKDHYLRPTTIEFIYCENILIEDVTIRNTPFWAVHPVFSKNITIRGLNIEKGTTNDDGIDPDSCTDVLIENCTIDTEDDAISIKAGRDQDAWERDPCENIIIRNSTLRTGVNGFCIGSEMSGGVRNVFVEDCVIPQARRGINFKCNLDRGGKVERVFIRNIKMENIEEEMFIFRMDYHGYRGNHYPTKFNDFFVSDIHIDKVGKTGFKIVGVEDQFIERVYLNKITIEEVPVDSEIKYAKDILANDVKVNGKVWKP